MTMTEQSAAAAAPEHPGPAEIRAALVEVAGGIETWDRTLDQLYADAVATNSFTKLEKFLTDSWRTVQLARAGVENLDRSRRVSRETFLAHAEALHGQSLLDDAA